jgi:hypothetical protein
MQHQGPKNSHTQPKPSAASSAPTAPWLPNSALPPVHHDSINSIVRNTLLATPEFPILYTDMVLSTRPNSREAKILRPKYQQILDRINLMENRKTCTHIKISGVRCGSPSLRGQQFCYYHQRMHRGVRTPPESRLHPLACIEDRESIQAALAEVINALLRNTIDMKRAALILRALHIAVKNAGRTAFKAQSSSMVKEIPEYDEPARSDDSDGVVDLNVPFEALFGQDPRATRPQSNYKTAEESARDHAEMVATYYGFASVEAHEAAKRAGWTPLSSSSARAKADALVRPGPEVPVRSAQTSTPAQSLTAHDFKNSLAPLKSQEKPAHPAPPSLANSTRKPSMNVKSVRSGLGARSSGAGS